MSFASDVKKELTNLPIDEEYSKAELSALIQMNGVISISSERIVVDIQTENAAIARRIYTLIKFFYPEAVIKLLVRKKMRLKKNNVYIVRIVKQGKEILQDLEIIVDTLTPSKKISPTFFKNKAIRSAYLRGAFLAGGSVNNPGTSSYHLEISTQYEDHAEGLRELMNTFYLNGRILERKKGFIVYLKEAEKISDFLGIIGAHNALLRFEDVRIVRDMRNSVNRLVNCETANMNKTISAALRQVENIKLIDRTIGLDALPDKLKEIAFLRLENQEASMKELGELASGRISKSGINHRFRKIEEIANKIRNSEIP